MGKRQRKKHKKKDAKAQPQPKREKTRQYDSSQSNGWGGRMTLAIYGLGILGAFGLTAFAILVSSHKTAAIWTLFTTIVIFALAFCLHWQRLVWGEEAPTVSPPKLEEPTFREDVEVATVWLGGMGAGYKLTALEENPREPFDFNGFKPLRMYVEGRKLYADFTVYGGTGNAPVEIRHNEFVVRPVGWDRNSNVNALEIVNENQVPIVQFIYKTPTEIVINGIFPFPGGLILASERKSVVNPILPATFRLKRIFKYPSWKYPGQYEQSR